MNEEIYEKFTDFFFAHLIYYSTSSTAISQYADKGIWRYLACERPQRDVSKRTSGSVWHLAPSAFRSTGRRVSCRVPVIVHAGPDDLPGCPRFERNCERGYRKRIPEGVVPFEDRSILGAYEVTLIDVQKDTSPRNVLGKVLFFRFPSRDVPYPLATRFFRFQPCPFVGGKQLPVPRRHGESGTRSFSPKDLDFGWTIFLPAWRRIVEGRA